MTKRKDLSDNESLDILRRLTQTPRPSQEIVAEETHHRKAKIGEVLKKYLDMTWEEAKAFCGNDQHILGLRKDYVVMRVTEEREARIKTEQAAEETEQHFAQLDYARTAIVDNYKKWVENPLVNLNKGRLEGKPLYPIGDLVYGGITYDSPLGSGEFRELLDVDKYEADDLLTHLKAEYPELANLHTFANLTDNKESHRIINLLQAHRGRYEGNCPHCPL